MVKNALPAIVWPGKFAEEASEYSELNSLIHKTVTEYHTDVILGRKNLQEGWDNYLQELNEIGLDRFIQLNELYITIGAQS